MCKSNLCESHRFLSNVLRQSINTATTHQNETQETIANDRQNKNQKTNSETIFYVCLVGIGHIAFITAMLFVITKLYE